jgi:DnaJ-like protein
MFVKTKERGGCTCFYLCIAEGGGDSGRGWKDVEYSVCLGETLNLSGTRWVEILRGSPDFRSVALERVLEVVEEYARKHGLHSELLAGLREVVREPSRHARRSGLSERRSQQDEYANALRALGLEPGASDVEIESAFRRAARRHHPDVGGESERFRKLVDARNLLLGWDAGASAAAGRVRRK